MWVAVLEQLRHACQWAQAPAHRQPDQQRQLRQANQVGQQAAAGDLADQFAAHIAAFAEQNPQPILAVLQQEQAPGVTAQQHVVVAGGQSCEVRRIAKPGEQLLQCAIRSAG